MAEHRRRRATRRREPEVDEDPFIASLPRDENWMAALRDDVSGDDATGAEAPTGPHDARGGVPWPEVEAQLEEQGSAIVALTARIDALEGALEEVRRRLPPEPGDGPPAPPTVREAIGALRAQALDAGARLGREVAARRRPRGEPPRP